MSQYDTLTGLELQIKRRAESIPFTFIFTTLGTGETITAVDSVTQSNRQTVTGSTDLTLTNLTHNAESKGQAWAADGTDDEFYCLTMTVTTSIGATRTCSGVLNVKSACNA